MEPAVIELPFDSMPVGARVGAMRPYLRELVTLWPPKGDAIKGTLLKLSKGAAILDTSVATNRPGMSTVSLMTIDRARIHIGGDWVSQSHRGAVLDAKMNIRCRKIDKDFIQLAADARTISASELVLEAALASSEQTLGKPKP